MANERTLNIKIPDKLYIALQKAAEQKSISLAALTRMLCSDWIMEQPQNIKGIFTFPEISLADMKADMRAEFLAAIAHGGGIYNQYGEAVFDEEDDGDYDDEYASLATPDEIDRNTKEMLERRNVKIEQRQKVEV
jgi:hypothetical protein